MRIPFVKVEKAMTFIGCKPAFRGCDTGISKVKADIQSTADSATDFEHNTVLSNGVEKTGIDWPLTEKRAAYL